MLSTPIWLIGTSDSYRACVLTIEIDERLRTTIVPPRFSNGNVPFLSGRESRSITVSISAGYLTRIEGELARSRDGGLKDIRRRDRREANRRISFRRIQAGFQKATNKWKFDSRVLDRAIKFCCLCRRWVSRSSCAPT